MGNGDSKLLDDKRVQNILDNKIKDKNDLIYAKMTRGQFQEFIKFLEYKKQIIERKRITHKRDDTHLEQQSSKYKAKSSAEKIGQSSAPTTKIHKPIDIDLEHLKKSDKLNRKPCKQLDNGISNCQPRMKSLLQTKPAKCNFRDTYENIYQQRQQDINKNYFTTLKKHGDVEKQNDIFLSHETRMNQLKQNNLNQTTHQKHFTEPHQRSQPSNHDKKQSGQDKQQKNRHGNYKNEINEFSNKIDPYKLLDIDNNESLEGVSKKYRRLALKFHPDRGGNKDAFQALTKAYLAILEDKKKREDDKSYFDLKKDFNSFNDTGEYKPAPLGKGEKFNSNLFNEIYEENKLHDETNKGYSDWMKTNSSAENNSEKLFSDKFNISVFNSVFNNLKKNETKGKEISKLYEPEPLSNAKGMDYMMLGQDGDDINFTNLNNRGLNYTDYKEAMTKSHLVSQQVPNKPKYSNLEELEKSRENVHYQMNEHELQEYQKSLKNKEKQEESRINRVKILDKNISDQYRKINYCLKNTETSQFRLTK